MCILRAGVAKLVYAPDSKSGELHCSCRFESDLRHHRIDRGFRNKRAQKFCWKILLRVYSRKSAAKFYFKILTLLDRHDVPRGRDCETKSTKVRTRRIGLVEIHVQAAQVLFRRQLVQVKRACVYRRLGAAESARHREPRELD